MIGLIFGETDLPKVILKKIKKIKKKYIIIDLTKKKILRKIKILGQRLLAKLEKLLKYLKKIDARKFFLLEV